jgi:hypothetical protein
MNSLGSILADEKQDHANAHWWFEKAAAGGLTDAMCNLGVDFEDGTGVTRDLEKAEYWLSKGAIAGNRQCAQMFKRLKERQR